MSYTKYRNRSHYSVATTLIFASWGLYYAFTRRYLSVELRGGVSAVMLIAGLEWLLTLPAILSARLNRVIGVKETILVGFAGSALFVVAIPVSKKASLLIPVIALSNLAWSLSWPSIVSFVLSKSTSPGRAYSMLTLGSGVGYGLGSAIMGFVYEAVGPEGVLSFISLLYASGYLALYALVRNEVNHAARNATPESIKEIASKKDVLLVLLALSLTVLGRELFYSVASYKLSLDIEEAFSVTSEAFERGLFGVLFGGLVAALSMPARYLAGILSDRYNPVRILIGANISYIATYWLFVTTKGLIPIVLWQIPLYPFLDVPVNTYVAKRCSGGATTLGLGAILLFTALGGLLQLVVVASGIVNPIRVGFIITTAVATSTLILGLVERLDTK